ncbi:MAG: LysR family transcriptional regulator [Candidimonas sp.]|nr:MAG: LysR family transcriptional regulator [Candidimonas sp.]TAM25139.1 MAG: LysR family transcriptional regulator [Candidimonas sp.]
MDTKWLQDFLTLADVGNFTRAAELRHSSQAAFSRRIQSLENWVGAKLIDRSRYPLYLTPEGESFQKNALAILSQLEEAKVSNVQFQEIQSVRIALSYTLALSRLPNWWKTWCGGQQLMCQTKVGNALETIAGFEAGAADILISYYQPTQNIPLEKSLYDRTILMSETLRPYCSEKLLKKRSFTFPGDKNRPVPFFNYSSDAYFHRLVNSIIEKPGAEFCGNLLGESEMSEVLSSFVAEGLGVAWLSDSSIIHKSMNKLVSLDKTGAWSMDIDVVAFVAKDKLNGHIKKIWQKILEEF